MKQDRINRWLVVFLILFMGFVATYRRNDGLQVDRVWAGAIALLGPALFCCNGPFASLLRIDRYNADHLGLLAMFTAGLYVVHPSLPWSWIFIISILATGVTYYCLFPDQQQLSQE